MGGERMKMGIKGTLLLACLTVAGSAHAGDPLDQAATAQARQQAPDAAQVGVFFHGAGAKTNYEVLLEANKCYWFSGVSEGLRKLYFYLWKPNASFFSPRVADAKSKGNVTMAYCTQAAGMYKFQVKTEGAGHYAVGVFAKDAPKQMVQAPPPAPAAIELGPICDQTASAGAQGARRQGNYFDGAGSSIGHDDRSDYTVMMQAGKCYWVVGCGEPQKVKSLYLYLWGPNGKRITESKTDSPNPMVGTCPQVTGMYKVQAKMNRGNGAWKVGVYAK
jgi:hypothetical protein